MSLAFEKRSPICSKNRPAKVQRHLPKSFEISEYFPPIAILCDSPVSPDLPLFFGSLFLYVAWDFGDPAECISFRVCQHSDPVWGLYHLFRNSSVSKCKAALHYIAPLGVAGPAIERLILSRDCFFFDQTLAIA